MFTTANFRFLLRVGAIVYYERFSGADVSLKPLEDSASRLARLADAAATGRLG
jgi:hypothetical protein